MKFEIVKVSQLSGTRATIYSVIVNDSFQTLLDQFLVENTADFPHEIDDITTRLNVIGHKTGAVETFFRKPEGKAGQDVFALYDSPGVKLRLYCIRLGNLALVLGGGGPKPKGVIKLQDDPKLKSENYMLREISDRLTQRIKDKEIWWSRDGMELEGDFIFEDED
ncbi:MAG: hypothetical protein IPM82_10155 [Saprospiraceae bacterium]|nr:hypothetical protein [Saprospiraceae bacterium]